MLRVFFIVECGISVLCVYLTFGHHPHPVPTFVSFVSSTAELAHGEKSCTQSITHPAYLMPREPKRLHFRIFKFKTTFCTHIVFINRLRHLLADYNVVYENLMRRQKTDRLSRLQKTAAWGWGRRYYHGYGVKFYDKHCGNCGDGDGIHGSTAGAVQSCVHRPTNEPGSHTKSQVVLTYCASQNPPKTPVSSLQPSDSAWSHT